MMWNHGVNKGRITLPKLVKVFCENPAKIFGLYPRKGVLMEGSDADIVIWDPSRVHHVNGQHGNTDYSSFDGFDLLGMPDVVMQRGVVIIENGELAARKPEGKFVKGDPNATPYAPHGYRL
jgi:dihydropyrimidinase